MGRNLLVGEVRSRLEVVPAIGSQLLPQNVLKEVSVPQAGNQGPQCSQIVPADTE